MATTTLKTRIQHKYDTPENWAKASTFVPLKGEICVFNNGSGVKPEMKIGDGTTTLASLPFLKAGGDITISRSLTSGTKIATITIDGVATNLYCQTNTNTTYSAGTGLTLSGTTFSIASSVLTTSNYTSYVPTKTGTGASGTWDINISGNANTANYLNIIASNEIRFNNFDYSSIWFHYIKPDGQTATTPCTEYSFGNGQRSTTGVTLHASYFTGNAATASSLSSKEPILSIGHENSAITIKGNSNGALGIDSYLSLKTAIDFKWYDSNWQIGNLRSGNTPSAGFGFACKQEGEESFSLKAKITPDSEFVLRNSSYEAILAPNVITTYGNLLLAGTQRSGYYGICLGNNNNYMTIMSGEVHQGLYNEANGKWILYYNRESGKIAINSSTIVDYAMVNINGSIKADRFWGPLEGNADSATTLSSTLAINKGGTGATINNEAYTNLINQGFVSDGDASLKRGLYTYSTSATNVPNVGGYGCIYNVISNGISEGTAIGGTTSSSWVWQLGFSTSHANMFIRSSINAGAFSPWKKMWLEGDSITGAVWNDYAEYRESTTTKPGLVVFENGDDTLSPTTKRLSHFAGIVSDTWGFCQGETERAKTPIAVAGRVLAYTYRDRNEYQPGDCVCAAPDGTVDIMTREEVEHYPDRIVGTVSCVPEYEEWGQGDRPAVKVDGRIWVKVR